MSLLHGNIRPIRLTPAYLGTAMTRTVCSLDAWTLEASNPPSARRSTGRTIRVG